MSDESESAVVLNLAKAAAFAALALLFLFASCEGGRIADNYIELHPAPAASK